MKKSTKLRIKKIKIINSELWSHYNSKVKLNLYYITMNDAKQKKENIKMQLKDLRQNLKKMHLAVTEEWILPKPDEVKKLMNKMDELLKLIEKNEL